MFIVLIRNLGGLDIIQILFKSHTILFIVFQIILKF